MLTSQRFFRPIYVWRVVNLSISSFGDDPIVSTKQVRPQPEPELFLIRVVV